MKHYRFIDVATQAYVATVAALVVVGHGRSVSGWGWYVGAHLAGLGLIHWLIHASSAGHAGRTIQLLREFYPLLLFPFLYRETAALNQMFHHGYFDAVFQRLDEQIFGFAPSSRFMAACPDPVVSEVFYAAYFSFYVMILGVGLALFLRERAQFRHYLSVVSLAFYACYLVYIFLPVAGPNFFDPGPDETTPSAVAPEFPAAVQDGFFFKIMAWIYRYGEAPGAAFPSSHVAVALVTVWFSHRYLRRIRWVHLAAAGLLCLATVYCRYHYAVDVVAGGLAAAVLLPAGNWLYARFGDKAPAAGGPRQTARS